MYKFISGHTIYSLNKNNLSLSGTSSTDVLCVISYTDWVMLLSRDSPVSVSVSMSALVFTVLSLVTISGLGQMHPLSWRYIENPETQSFLANRIPTFTFN